MDPLWSLKHLKTFSEMLECVHIMINNVRNVIHISYCVMFANKALKRKDNVRF